MLEARGLASLGNSAVVMIGAYRQTDIAMELMIVGIPPTNQLDVQVSLNRYTNK